MAEQLSLMADGELPAHPTGLVQQAFDIYQAAAKAAGWRQATVLDDGRQTAITRALKTYGGLAGFRAALERASKSSFLLGKTGRSGVHANWKPGLDFFLQRQSIRNLIEGAYDDAPTGTVTPKATWREKQVDDAKAALKRALGK